MTVPRYRQTVLDAEHPRTLAEFWRELLDLAYRPGDEPPPDGEPDPLGDDWLVLHGHGAQLAFQRADDLPPSTWPEPEVPQQLHLDLAVDSPEELTRQHARVLALGGQEVLDRFDDEEEPLYVFRDPAGHPFCIFVAHD